MTRAMNAAMGLAMGVVATVVSGQSSPGDRIGRVESGLAPGLQIGASSAWTLGDRLAHHKVPGLSIAVINGGKVEWSRQYGVRDAKTGEPVGADTLFQVASITKPVTATVALKLVEKGILDLDRDVNGYLKSWKVPENELTREQKVTLRRLLSHSAGLTVSGFRGYAAGEAVPSMLQVLDGTPPANSAPIRVDQKPGSGFRYSGGGYTVLQVLIEDVTGRSLADLTEEVVLKPAGMTHSSMADPLPAGLAGLRSSAHRQDGTPFPGHSFLLGGSACCGLWTTAGDLASFAVETGRALRGESSAMLTPAMAKAMVVPTNSESQGLGWRLERHGKVAYLSHGGGNPGFSSFLIFHPTAGYGVAIVTNADGGHRLAREIVQSVAREYGWEGMEPRRFASAEAFIDEIRGMVRANPNDLDVSEGSLNRIGYELAGDGQADAALRVFALNAELRPRSANCQDSLAEAHETSGNFAAAIQGYRKAVELLDRFPDQNKGYAGYRERTLVKIGELEEKARKERR
ncbi:MAG: serine hydrolase [Thermoanaerobaculaceae bacterium]|nr:serine hydrolase [Thermoanaerobaculaceae bacterium]